MTWTPEPSETGRDEQDALRTDEAIARVDEAEARAADPAPPMLELADVEAAIAVAPLDAPAPVTSDEASSEVHETAAQDVADGPDGAPSPVEVHETAAHDVAEGPDGAHPHDAGEADGADGAGAPAAPVPTTPTPEELELAATALHEVTPRGAVGDVIDALLEGGERSQVLAIRHASALPGYPDWTWTVLLSRGVEGGPTVLEVALLPGETSLLAPAWVPWSERLADYLAAKQASGEGELDEDDEALESDLESDLEDDFDDDFDEVELDADLDHVEVAAASSEDAHADGWHDGDAADGTEPS